MPFEMFEKSYNNSNNDNNFFLHMSELSFCIILNLRRSLIWLRATSEYVPLLVMRVWCTYTYRYIHAYVKKVRKFMPLQRSRLEIFFLRFFFSSRLTKGTVVIIFLIVRVYLGGFSQKLISENP